MLIISSKVWLISIYKYISDQLTINSILSDAHVDHVLEGLVQVVAHFLDLHLLSEQVFLHLDYYLRNHPIINIFNYLLWLRNFIIWSELTEAQWPINVSILWQIWQCDNVTHYNKYEKWDNVTQFNKCDNLTQCDKCDKYEKYEKCETTWQHDNLTNMRNVTWSILTLSLWMFISAFSPLVECKCWFANLLNRTNSSKKIWLERPKVLLLGVKTKLAGWPGIKTFAMFTNERNNYFFCHF